MVFQWAPTLGGECYLMRLRERAERSQCFNGHPPLGVNATRAGLARGCGCHPGFNGHPPLGVNATAWIIRPYARGK